jgi:hypothetical protein
VRADSDEVPGASPAVALGIRVVLLLGCYVLLERLLIGSAQLEESSYHEPLLLLEVGRRLGWLAGLAVGLGVCGLLRYGALWRKWTAYDLGRQLQCFVTVLASTLAWSFSTYDYNHYYDQGHDADRLLLVVLAVLVGWRPLFVIPFVVQVSAIIWQFNYPIGGYSVAEQFMLVRVLVLFAAALVVLSVTAGKRTTEFVYLTCCLIAAHYLCPGLGKLRLNWITHGHINFLTWSAYANGWLGFLEPSKVASFTQWLAWLDWPMRVFTIVAEVGAILFLHRRVLPVMVIVWVAFHVGIFAVCGICFWKWIIVDAALWVCFFRKNHAAMQALCSRTYFVVSIVVIAGGVVLFDPVNLSWYNTRASYTYRFEAIGESGATYDVPVQFFDPYGYQFTLSHFGYLAPGSHMPITWGSTVQRPLADALVEAQSPEDVWALEATYGEVRHSTAKSLQFDAFVAQFVGNANRRGKDVGWWYRLAAPPQLWTFSRGIRYAGQEPIAVINCHRVTSFFDGKRYAEIRTARVRSIDIPALHDSVD